MSKVRGGLSAFERWFGNSIVRDEAGKPLVVYRGEHGEPGSAPFQSRLPSLSFGSQEAANIYAMDPNDPMDWAIAPRVSPNFLKIERPIIDNPSDPFIDMKDVAEKLDPALAEMLARRHAYSIEGTNNWDENFRRTYAGVEELLADKPKLLNELYTDAYPMLDDPDFVKAARAKGFDGARHIGNGETSGELEYRIFDPSQAWSVFMKKATGGLASVQREQKRLRDINSNSPAEEMLDDRRYRNFIDDYDALYATRPIGGTDDVRLPKVQRFWGGGLAEALGDTSRGGFDFGGITGGGGYVGNTGQIGVGAAGGYQGSMGSALGNTTEGNFGMGWGDGVVGGSSLGTGSDWSGGFGEGAGGQAAGEPGYTGIGADIMSQAGIGFPEAYYTGSPLGMNGLDLYSPTPIAEQNPDFAAALPDAQQLADPRTQYEQASNILGSLAVDTPRIDEERYGPSFGFGPYGAPAGVVDPMAAYPSNPVVEDVPDEGMPSAVSGPMTEKGRGAYTEDGVKGISPQGVRNLAALSANEAMPIARSIARRENITMEEAMPKAYQHVVETVLNRSTVGRSGFGGQTYNPSITDVMNARSQFSGVPGTHGAGRTPGRVNELPASPQDIQATIAVLNQLEDGRRSYPRALDFANASIPEVAAKDWVQDMLEQPGTSRIGYGSGSHWVGNVNNRNVGNYDINVPDMSGFVGSAPTSPVSRNIMAEVFGITPAMASEDVATPGSRFAEVPDDIPEIDIWQGEKDFFNGISRGIRSLTGTLDDGTQPVAPAPRGPTANDFGITDWNPQQSTLSRATQRDPVTNQRIADMSNALELSMTGLANRPAIEQPAVPETPVPQAPPGNAVAGVSPLGPPVDVSTPPSPGQQYAYADVPMPPERPEEFYNLDEVEQARQSIAAATAASSPPVDATPQNGYNRIPEGYVKHGVNTVAGLIPGVGAANMLAGLFGYSLGDVMGKNPPNYGPPPQGVGEGVDPFGRTVPMSAPTQVASVAAPATSVGQTINPGFTTRSFLGLDDPRTYGMRAQQTLFSARGGLASLKES